jgi:hypothetical protein
MHNLSTALLMAVALALPSNLAEGQERRPHLPTPVVSLRVEIEDADPVRESPGFRLYAVPTEIVTSIALFNETMGPSAAIVVDKEAFRRNLRIALEQPADLGVTIRWLPFAASSVGGPTSESTRVTVFPGRGTALRAAITPRAGGRFLPGSYTVRVELEDIASVASSAAAQPVPRPRPHITPLTIVEARTAEDRAKASRQLGRAAMKKGQLEQAETYFLRAADEQGGGLAGLTDLGEIYLRRGKYRQAIECFERLMPTVLSGSSAVPQMLAEAYVGVGDEPRALQVLERLGMPTEFVATEMERYRQNVSQRNPR